MGLHTEWWPLDIFLKSAQSLIRLRGELSRFIALLFAFRFADRRLLYLVPSETCLFDQNLNFLSKPLARSRLLNPCQERTQTDAKNKENERGSHCDLHGCSSGSKSPEDARIH